MKAAFRVSKLIRDKLYEKEIDEDLKDLIWEILLFENSNTDGKYSATYKRLIEQYYRRKTKE